MTSPAISANPSLPSFTGPSIAIGKSSDSICDAVEADGIRNTSRLTASQASSPPAPRQVKTKPKTVVELRNVCKTYLIGEHAVAALRGVSLTISRGEFVLIYGKSGSGKSTLLSIMGTVDLATKGDVSVLGTRVNARTKDDILAQLRLTQVGFMFQSFNLLQVSSARENVLLPMRLAGRLGWRERGRRADYLLEKVGMEDRKGSRPSQLSGGEQQRVTIARALANEPEVLLMDEPTGDLDGVNADRIMEMLVDLHDEGRTLVMVTHDRRLRGLADRVLYVCDGLISHEEVVADGVKRGIRGALRERNALRN